MMKNMSITVFILFWILIAVGFIGWFKNLVSFVKLDFQEPYKAEVIRGASLFIAPAGAVVGWVNIKD